MIVAWTYKARLVAKCFKQTYVIDYENIFSILLLKLSLFVLFCLLIFLKDGLSGNLMFKMLSLMAF